ncbi:conjugative transfer signal peptidase TraF [Pseudacidovorax sp. RU35E]|nr:conjugative transfer signal peptidase TraF [Pseudacidovorax sp. RU35E]
MAAVAVMSVVLLRAGLLVGMVLASGALIAPLALPLPVRVVFNPTASVARGWYRIDAPRDPRSLHPGAIVLARLPHAVASFAAQRGYLPEGVPVLKRIGAMAPERVCVSGQQVVIEDTAVGVVLAHDGAGRPLPSWLHCRRLVHGELFLLGDAHPASFDSRYFGPVGADAVLGIARPLWIW